MGKLKKYANLYDKDGNLLREAPLKDYSIKELEELIDSLPQTDVQGRSNCIRILTQMYMNLRTEEDKQYVQQKQQELLKQLYEQNKPTEEQATEALQEVEKELKKEEEPMTQEDLLTERENVDEKMEEYVDFEEVTDENN